jgi:hypothetical protein
LYDTSNQAMSVKTVISLRLIKPPVLLKGLSFVSWLSGF